MPHLYACNDYDCQYNEHIYSLNEITEHLRQKHVPNIRRPSRLGIPDNHGNVWYYFQCEGTAGKDHRSFRSDIAMWGHLNSKHDHELDSISLEQ
jgi:hypothetical protein